MKKICRIVCVLSAALLASGCSKKDMPKMSEISVTSAAASETVALLLSTLETVATETPAALATSFIVTFESIPPV